MLTIPEIITRLKVADSLFSLFFSHVANTSPQNIINITCKQMQNFHGQMNVLKGEIERWKKGNYSIVFLGPDRDRVKKVRTSTLGL